MERAGIEGKRTKASCGRTLSSLTFHSLRHSFDSALTNGGVSQEIRQKLTGHASAEMNAIYTHHELAALRAAVAVIPRSGAQVKNCP
jgi:integrase